MLIEKDALVNEKNSRRKETGLSRGVKRCFLPIILQHSPNENTDQIPLSPLDPVADQITHQKQIILIILIITNS
jgi:hypothetical protein